MDRRYRRGLRALVAALTLTAAGSVVTASAFGAPQAEPVAAAQLPSVRLTWTPIPTGSPEDFRGVKAVNRDVIWVAGTHGRVLRTVDGGRSWQDVSPPGAADVYFRDIESTSSRHAVLHSVSGAENQPSGRVWVTDDGGATWTSPLATTDPRSFFDCLAFSSPSNGYLVGDPVDGKFEFYRTSDAGHHWQKADTSGMPAALEGEFAFAAGGTCMSAVGSAVWFGTGGSASRVFRSVDRGVTWTVSDTPIVHGESAGVFSVQFRDSRNGIAVGGDIANRPSSAHTAAWTDDGGRTWHEPTAFPAGLRTAATWVSVLPIALAVGPTGSDVSVDAGRSWSAIDGGSWTTVSCATDLTCVIVGLAGSVGRLTLSAGRG
jgi:photosystem II stability/assembly factor-like uncharacterized protein